MSVEIHSVSWIFAPGHQKARTALLKKLCGFAVSSATTSPVSYKSAISLTHRLLAVPTMQQTKISCFPAILLWNSLPVIPMQTTCIIHIKQDLDEEEKASTGPDKQKQRGFSDVLHKNKVSKYNPHGRRIKGPRCLYWTIISLSQELPSNVAS